MENEDNQQGAKLTDIEIRLIKYYRSLTDEEKLIFIEKSKQYSACNDEDYYDE